MSSEEKQSEASLLISAFITLGEKVDKLCETFSQHNPPAHALGLRRPYHGSVFSGAAPANPLLVTATTWPAAGRFWEITDAGVYLQDGHTVSTGATADVYAGPAAGMNAPGDLPSFIFSSSIPTGTSGLIGHDKEFCFANDRIYAWIYSPVVNVTYTLAGTITDWPLWARNFMEQ